MSLGRKSSIIMQSLGVKKSLPSYSFGVKQSRNPHMDSDNLAKQHTSNGIIHNTSNSNDNNYQPIKGVLVSSSNKDKNNLEKPRKLRPENNYFNK